MNNWDEVRTAFQVARIGTVSGAAEVLGVHHATVIRHVDALEARLGIRLFHRHARGYTPTEAGADLMRVAQATEDQFGQLTARLKGHGDDVAGELVVTSLAGLSPLLVPTLAAFQNENPRVTVRFLAGPRLFRLEYGEAHVAIRAGSAPDQPDNVVQPFIRQRVALYASTCYINQRGQPKDELDFMGHRFVDFDDPDTRAPFSIWLRDKVSDEQLAFRANADSSMRDAVRAGAGMGFLPIWDATQDADLIQVLPPRPEWESPLWLVTHVDLHRTTKVQTFLKFLKSRAQEWQT
ncbi:LysR family transcriptional regulator [Chachezhania sediminis]|uniref:LysR family transcriptional regulator n=1 Tax=Chachezhania sediminis TaxID=2599291 RepID=UPI00131BEFFF|nr:LysR family transcriptional regulator [Chachezhania sediminis]